MEIPKNVFKQRLANKEKLIGSWLMSGSPVIAEAMGCVGIRVDSPEEVQPAIEKANSIDDRPVVIDFRVDASEKVYPMVPAGASNDELILPAFQDKEYLK